MSYIPNRGDVVWLNFDPQAGHEQSGKRPAVVISPKAYNQKVGLGLFCPITHHVKGYPFEVKVPGGLTVKGVVLSDQIKSLDWKARQAEFIAQLPKDVIDEILKKVMLLIQ
ncbi:MAG: endoribonuclease MazF [Blastocatellia bacterium]|nr:endoribonuclease MazF [Blastocatellia bacterium]